MCKASAYCAARTFSCTGTHSESGQPTYAALSEYVDAPASAAVTLTLSDRCSTLENVRTDVEPLAVTADWRGAQQNAKNVKNSQCTW